MNLTLLQLLCTSGIISLNRFFMFKRITFSKAVFFQLNSSTFNTSAVFQQISTNKPYITSLFQINFTKKKMLQAPFSPLLPSIKGYSLFPFSPQTEQSIPVALQVEESPSIHFDVRFLPSLITCQTARGFGMLRKGKPNLWKFHLCSPTLMKKEIKSTVQEKPLLIIVKCPVIMKSSSLLAIIIGKWTKII